MTKRNWKNAALLWAAIGVLAPLAQASGPQTPRKVMAILDVSQNMTYFPRGRAVSFYDVTTLGPNTFAHSPMFSVFLGYEDYYNQEEPGAIAINPVNGTTYVLAHDSGDANTQSGIGDWNGDKDLYRIDYQELLADYLDPNNARQKGTMYYPLDPAYDNFGDNVHPNPTLPQVGIAGAISKIGEVARNDDSEYFDPVLEYVNPARLVMLDEANGDLSDGNSSHWLNGYAIRALNRVSDANGLATHVQYDKTGTDPNAGPLTVTFHEGGWNGATEESWESRILGWVNQDANGVGLDQDGDFHPIGRAEPEDIAYGTRDGVEGVWIGENDFGGDKLNDANDRGDTIAFFEINNWDGTAENIYRNFATGDGSSYRMILDQDPTVDPNGQNGSLDWVATDAEGNLIIGESGYFDEPQHEPKIITRGVYQYDDGNDRIAFAAWGTHPPMAPTLVDDGGNLIDGRFTVAERNGKRVWYFDIDGSDGNYANDVYVYDLDSNTLVYQEIDGFKHYLEIDGMEIFTRGDIDGDGQVDETDVEILHDTIHGGTDLEKEGYDLTGDRTADANDKDAILNDILGLATGDLTMDGDVNEDDIDILWDVVYLSDPDKDWYDLTGDNNITADDVTELVEGILGTRFGDTDTDGDVDLTDFGRLATNYEQPGVFGWYDGDTDGDGDVDLTDFGRLATEYGFGTDGGESPAIPEPASLALLGLGALAAVRRRRR